MGVAAPEISSEAMTLLSRLPYPGNIRQLKNMVERALITSAGSRIESRDFEGADAIYSHPDIESGSASDLEAIERKAVESALAESGGNLSRAALRLGISRQALYRRMAKYGIG